MDSIPYFIHSKALENTVFDQGIPDQDISVDRKLKESSLESTK
jgi:hypothetical protein